MSAGPLARVLAAEAIGTFALVFAGCGAIMVDASEAAAIAVGGTVALDALLGGPPPAPR